MESGTFIKAYPDNTYAKTVIDYCGEPSLMTEERLEAFESGEFELLGIWLRKGDKTLAAMWEVESDLSQKEFVELADSMYDDYQRKDA